MLHGMGKSQRFLRESYSDDRNRALEDRTKFTHAELVELEVTKSGEGAGRTDDDTYLVWNLPHTKKVDIRNVH